MACGMVSAATGLAMMNNLKQGKSLEGSRALWADLNKLKVFLMVLLTPFNEPLVSYSLPEEQREDEEALGKRKNQVQATVVVLLLVLSIGAKVYREELCNNFEVDPLTMKLLEMN